MTAIEYAKYTEQDVLILQVDIAEVFDIVHWDFIAQMAFGLKLVHAIYWLPCNFKETGNVFISKQIIQSVGE